MQYTGLVLSLEKQALQAIRAELMVRTGKGSDLTTDVELVHVRFEDFAVVVLQHMFNLPLENRLEQPLYTYTTAFHLQMASIISVFDAVDVDNRGVISFVDFTNFCLRLGRLIFKPSIKKSLTNYLQFPTVSNTAFPSTRMRYLHDFSTIVVMDLECPRVRFYKLVSIS